MINYNGHKVAYIENADHLYAHVAVIDGDQVAVTDGGQLVITDKFSRKQSNWNSDEQKLVTAYEAYAPAKWNFVYDNKNPDVEAGVHKIEDGKLPELFENVDGEVA